MLDFYFLPPKTIPPESPDDLELAMDLCMEDFELLDNLWIMLRNLGLELSYVKDSFIPAAKMNDFSAAFEQFQQELDSKARKKLESPLGKLRKVISTANSREMGLCSYCD